MTRGRRANGVRFGSPRRPCVALARHATPTGERWGSVTDGRRVTEAKGPREPNNKREAPVPPPILACPLRRPPTPSAASRRWARPRGARKRGAAGRRLLARGASPRLRWDSSPRRLLAQGTGTDVQRSRILPLPAPGPAPRPSARPQGHGASPRAPDGPAKAEPPPCDTAWDSHNLVKWKINICEEAGAWIDREGEERK